jgi:PTH1 family peptidyl-tRNA hydrolase
MSFNRGAGGHNGVKSVSRALKTDAYIRLRIGVSPTTPSGKIKKPHGEEGVLNYILKPFRNKELEIKKIFKSAVESLETICTESREKATTVVNSK